MERSGEYFFSPRFWGFFALNMMETTETQFVESEAEFAGLLADPELDVQSAVPLPHSDSVMVQYRRMDQLRANPKSSVILASHVTSYARLVLLELLEKAGPTAIYGAFLPPSLRVSACFSS